MEHTATVLLFDASGSFVTTISPHEPDSDALAALQKLVA
jgi:cytochrome oxidase Cu insertion factor (SCO1/SenC/PrrC family)